MQRSRTPRGVVAHLLIVQYCTFLFGGGALWYLSASATGYFWGDPAAQAGALLALGAVILAESWWVHMPGARNELLDYLVDVITSGLIAAFGMAVVAAIFLWLA